MGAVTILAVLLYFQSASILSKITGEASSMGELIGGVLFGTLGILMGFFAIRSSKSKLKEPLDLLIQKEKTAHLLHKDNVRKSDSYFDSLVKINVDNLAEYYSMVKLHTDKSFTVSISAGILGFVLIVIGLVSGFNTGNSDQIIAYISTGAGVVTEFIAGVFFYLYNRTVRQLKGYHDSLLAVQNILLSFKILDDIKDESVKVQMVGQMMAFLMNKSPVPLVPSATQT